MDVGWPGRSVTLVNDLQGAITRRFPEVQAMVDACLSEGALGAAMTGSGSAVFGLFPLASVRRAASRLRRPGWMVLATRTLARREAGRLMGL
jgi:4-diphosphocytidyl-2C-methyl-D-erythritol kinase